MSEPYEEEMLRRARRLVEAYGDRTSKVDKAYDVWFRSYRVGDLYLEIREADDKVLVSLRNMGGAGGIWAVYYPNMGFPNDSVYKPEHYQECVELMRPLMVLDDLADV